MATKRYYWLKLKEDFFDDDTIQYIEEQPNGILYSNFYLKLCLKALKNNGRLIRVVGNTLIPYDIPALAKLTNVPVDTVRCAMALFRQFGLVSELETGELVLHQIDELVGSETDKAASMRKLRARKEIAGNNVTPELPPVTHELPECYTDIEIDNRDRNIENREKDKDKDLSIKSGGVIEGSGGKEDQSPDLLELGIYGNVKLSQADYDFLKNSYPFCDKAIDRLSINIFKNGDNGDPHFGRLMQWLTIKALGKSGKEGATEKKENDPDFNSLRNAAIAKLQGVNNG